MKIMTKLIYNRKAKMDKPRLKKLAAAGMLALSATALSLPAFSHQQSTGMMGGDGQMGMMGNMKSGGHMGMMGNMKGGGHMGMMGNMMGGDHMGMMGKFKGLDLSDEQKAKMSEIRYKLRKKHWEIMGPMIDQQAALHKAYAGDRPDPAAVGAVYGKIFDLKRQVIEARLTAKNSSMDVLTEEQLAQMEKMKHKGSGMMHGQGGMMHGQGGMMHGQGGMMQGQGGMMQGQGGTSQTN
jgi:Spy/CpxP family protein refolding chaperone